MASRATREKRSGFPVNVPAGELAYCCSLEVGAREYLRERSPGISSSCIISAVFGGAPCECRSSASIQSEAARSSSIIMHAGGLRGPWVHDFKRAALAAARKDAEAFSLVS